MFAGACHLEPDTVGLPAAKGTARVKEVVHHARNIDPRPANDPVQESRYRTEIGDEFGGNGYALLIDSHLKLAQQLPPPIGATLGLKRPADNKRPRHRDLLMWPFNLAAWIRSLSSPVALCLPSSTA